MAHTITSPFEITYNGLTVGGTSSTYQLHGPYAYDRSPTAMRLVFDVVVVATSYATLQTLSEALETAFAARDGSLTINADKGDTETSWTFLANTSILNPSGSVSKSARPEADRGVSRVYTVTVEGEVPSDDAGLRDLEVTVQVDPARKKTVTMRGTYATSGARAAYSANRDSEDPAILSAIDSTFSWELVDESHTADRKDVICNFSRTYVQLIMDQSSGVVDDSSIRDHRVTFQEHIPSPGDAKEDVERFRTVTGTYDCSLDVDVVTPANAAMKGVYESKILGLLVEAFEANFEPSVFAIEDQQVAYDETYHRVSAQVQFTYKKEGGEDIVSLVESLAYREQRQLARTPVYTQDEYAMNVDPGWAVRQRIATRTVMVLGKVPPRRRIGPGADGEGKAGEITGLESDGKRITQGEGWNMISNASLATPKWIGIAGVDNVEQIEVTVLDETVIEEFHTLPKASSGYGGTPRP
jgi:hypothetical protein